MTRTWTSTANNKFWVKKLKSFLSQKEFGPRRRWYRYWINSSGLRDTRTSSIEIFLYLSSYYSLYLLKWKVAKITVLKKTNKETYKTPKSFRPISVLNTLGKKIEKIIYEIINWLSKENMWLKDNQHGFRGGKEQRVQCTHLLRRLKGISARKNSPRYYFWI